MGLVQRSAHPGDQSVFPGSLTSALNKLSKGAVLVSYEASGGGGAQGRWVGLRLFRLLLSRKLLGQLEGWAFSF